MRDVCIWNPGTQISDVILDIETAGVHTVKGFATIDDVALINVEVSSITQKLQHRLRKPLTVYRTVKRLCRLALSCIPAYKPTILSCVQSKMVC